MSKGFIVGNGGGDILYSISCVYPEGSELTCKDEAGTIELKANNTSGLWIFSLPFPGKWTVTSTDPTGTSKPASKTVEITKEGQSEKLELSYNIILFDSETGGDNTSITGGWESIDGGGKLNVGTEKLSFISAVANIRRGAVTVKPIPLYGKTILYALGGTTVAEVTDNYTLAIINEKSTKTSAVVAQARLIKGSTAEKISIPLDGLEPDVDYYVAVFNSSSGFESFITKCLAE